MEFKANVTAINVDLGNHAPLIITIFKLRTLCSPQYLRSALPYSFPCGKMDSNTFTVYGSHFNLQQIKEAKFIVANIILVKVRAIHIRSQSDRKETIVS